MNSFTYDYPVRNYFGEGAMDQALDAEMGAMGKTVMLAYGGGSVKRTGVYGHVVQSDLREVPGRRRARTRGAGRLHSRRRRRVGLRLLQGGLRAGDA